MADAARDIDDVKASDRPSGGEPKLQMKSDDSNGSSSNQPPPQTEDALTVGTASKEEIDKYKIYGYNKCNMKLGVGDAEAKRQRRMVKYNSYAVESKLKSSLMNWFHWSKNK
ncbi:hypothetical protein HRI_004665300 [Hibiscus trionum]|uniref:Uncharacterized protein n=1 Tax=Hibiscus trionum TaxID=183268 RepID=A0A9W7J8K6_HIBTR|nr:hypothetical protein HRI_004665300 [Hibiscus trionum]